MYYFFYFENKIIKWIWFKRWVRVNWFFYSYQFLNDFLSALWECIRFHVSKILNVWINVLYQQMWNQSVFLLEHNKGYVWWNKSAKYIFKIRMAIMHSSITRFSMLLIFKTFSLTTCNCKYKLKVKTRTIFRG